jgi:hypothetical protein
MNVWEWLKDVAAIAERLDMLAAEIERERAARQRMEEVLMDIRERLTRLEAARDFDRAQMAADLARFKAEVERAELKLSRMLSAPSEPPAPSEQGKESAE